MNQETGAGPLQQIGLGAPILAYLDQGTAHQPPGAAAVASPKELNRGQSTCVALVDLGFDVTEITQ